MSQYELVPACGVCIDFSPYNVPSHAPSEQVQFGLLSVSEREVEAQRALWFSQDHRDSEDSTREQGF